MKIVIAEAPLGCGKVPEPLAKSITPVKGIPSHQPLPARGAKVSKPGAEGVPMEPVEPHVHPLAVDNVSWHPLMDGDPLVDRDAPLVDDELGHHFLCQGRVESGGVHVVHAPL